MRNLSVGCAIVAWALFAAGNQIGSWWLLMWPVAAVGLAAGIRGRSTVASTICGAALLPLPLMLVFFGG